MVSMKKSAKTSKKVQAICFQCMEIMAKKSVCDHCGYDNQQYDSNPQFLDPGTILKEKYLLGIPLGTDGFYNTYVAFDQKANQRVVIKEYFPLGLATRGVDKHHVRPNVDESQNELFIFGKRAFLKESMTLADVRMQNVVPVINYFSENNTAYCVTNYIMGTDLDRHLMIRGGRLSVREAIDIIIPVLSTLHKLHKKNLFHYNLSLSKIMIVHQGEPVLLGFGQAKQMMDKQSESIRNTIQYNNAPPEQYDTKGKFGAWSDVYCCGIILYRMITGKAPLPAEKRIKNNQWISPIKHKGISISQELSDVIDHSVSIDPASRYKSARDFLKAIKARIPKDSKSPGKNIVLVTCLVLFVITSIGLTLFYFQKGTKVLPPVLPTAIQVEKTIDVPKDNKKTIDVLAADDKINDIPKSDIKTIETLKSTKKKNIFSHQKIEEIKPTPNKTLETDLVISQEKEITPITKSSEEDITPKKRLRVCGDQELCNYLTPALAKAFLESKDADSISQEADENGNVQLIGNHPDQIIQINIYATGTDNAFEMLAYNRCDIAFSGRKISKTHRESFSNIDEIEQSQTEHLIALDGVVVLNHSDNPVRSLTVKEVKDIFSGKIKTWNQVGGLESDIRVLMPEKKFDLYQEFKQQLLENNNIQMDKVFRNLAQLSKEVSEDIQAIGICSLPFILNNKALAIADNEINPIRPSYFSITTDEYLFVRKIYCYTILVSASETTLPFVTFVQSTKGQEIIKQYGYIDRSVKALRSKRELWTKPVNSAVFKKLVGITKHSLKLSMNFYFNNNDDQLTSEGHEKIKELTSWLKHQPSSTKIVVIGYSDSVGSYRQNCIVALERAEMVAREMKISGIYVDDIETACEEFPIASNQTEKGRQKNRRVEIWVKRH